MFISKKISAVPNVTEEHVPNELFGQVSHPNNLVRFQVEVHN